MSTEATPSTQTERLDLVILTAELMADVLAGRRDEIQSTAGFAVPPDWPDAHDTRFLRLRLDQVLNDRKAEEWLARAMVLRGDPARPMIGHIGLHGPPQDEAVEIGYTVFPTFREKGFATEAVTGLMAWARERGVSRFILSISPGNAPSLAVARKLGFKRIGRQMDEEDGLEYVFELKG